jgi:Na+-transporting NADH:ubiquinone oxidoreductase subunit B
MMADAKKKRPRLLQRQPLMRRVIVAALPCVAGSVYFFGWRSLAVLLVSCGVGFAAEWAFCRRWKQPVSEAVFVTAVLFALVMPPTVPWHVVVFGMLFAVVLTKMLFGGFGRNVFNPALAGRCFVYVCFPVALTAMWSPPAAGTWGALDRWTTATSPDVISGASPMGATKAAALDAAAAEGTEAESREERAYRKVKPSYADLLVGRISGTMGVTSALLILVGGVCLMATRTASWHIILSTIAAYLALNQVLHWSGVPPVPDGLTAALGGGFLFGAFFMATDPISAAKTKPGQVIYGILIATSTVVIRNFSIFNGGLMFSILIGNMFAPVIDRGVRSYQSRGRKRSE